MTRHKHAHTGLVTPSLPQLLLTATLRLFAMLVSSVASTLQMWFRRPAVNATRPMPDALPEETSDTPQQETLDRALTRPTRQSTRSVETDAAAHDDDRQIIVTPGSGSLIRIPREGGDPVLLDKDAREALKPCSFKAEQASWLALDSRLRGRRGRESSRTNSAHA